MSDNTDEPTPQALIAASLMWGLTNLGLGIFESQKLGSKWEYWPIEAPQTVRRTALRLDGHDVPDPE